MNKIYSLLATLIAFTWLTACGPDKDKIRFEGQLDNINDAEFYILSEDGAFSGIDTVKITDGKFTYERDLSTPAVLTLLYPNFTQTYIVAEPGQTVKMKAGYFAVTEDIKGQGGYNICYYCDLCTAIDADEQTRQKHQDTCIITFL